MARKELVVEFSPGTGPFDTPTWIKLTAGGPHGNRLRSAQWEWGRQRDDKDFPAGTATIVLTNHDRLFDPDNTSGTYTGDLGPRVPFRLTSSDGDDLFYGFVQSGWDQTYDHPVDGYCTITLVDMLGVIEGYTLPSVFSAEVAADTPVAYWPLDETQRAAMRDATGVHPDGQYIDGTTRLASTVETAAGLPVRGLDLDGEHFGQIRDQAATVHARPCCIEIVFQPNDENATQILYRSGTGNANEGNTVQYSCNGSVWSITSAIRDGDADNLAATDTRSVIGAGGAMHHYVIRRPATGAAEAWLDGEDVTLTTGTAPANGISVAPGSIVGASDYQGAGHAGTIPTSTYYGFIGGVAIYDTDLSDARIEAHAEAALAPLDGQRSDEQITWVLDQIGVPGGLRSLDVGRTLMGPAHTEGRNALSYLRSIARTEQGALYVDHHDGGKIRFVERFAAWLATRSTAAQATISDDPTNSTAVRVEPGTLAVEANGIESVVNQASVRWVGGEETAEDATSVAAYGPRGQTVQTIGTHPNQALGLAQWLVALQAEPAVRVRGFGINPAGNDDGFSAAVGLRPYDLVTFRSQPSSTGSVVTRNLLIQGGRHDVEGLHWETTFYTAQTAADLVDLFILGTSLLDGTDVLGY